MTRGLMQSLRHFINPLTGEVVRVLVRYYSDKRFQQTGIACSIKLRKTGPLGSAIAVEEQNHIFDDPERLELLLNGKTLKL